MDGNHLDGLEGRGGEAERMHQLLCATVLGEASDEERAEVERAIASSPELAAERERLHRTIGLVTESLTVDGELSPSARAELDRALARKSAATARPWWTSTPLKIAAAIALLPIGYGVWKLSRTERVAPQLDSSPFSYGIFGDSSETDGGKLKGDLLARAQPAPSEGGPLKKLGYTESESTTVGASNSNQLGIGRVSYESAPQAPSVTGQSFADADRAAGKRSDLALAFGAAASDAPEHQVSHAPVLAEESKGSPAPQAGASAAGEVATYRFGRPGDVDRVSDSTAGSYRSASDSVPAEQLTSLGRATGIAPTGPSSPGVGGSAVAKNETEALRELGYVGEDGDLGELERSKRGRENAKDGDDVVVGADGQPRRQLSQAALETRIEEILNACRRRPGERPRDMFFRFWGDNPFELASSDRLSTFSIDVDTASYALARNTIASGYLPRKEQVRTEEFVNYFTGDVEPPTEGAFRIQMELAPSLLGGSQVAPVPWTVAEDGQRPASETWMLRVGVRAREVAKEERKPLHLTFVVDVSGSMREDRRLELVKHALRQLTSQLDARDALSIVAFSNEARLVLPMTSAARRDAIETAIHPLHPEASTNTEAGLRLGFEQAAAGFSDSVENRVVLLTDGVANVGVTDPQAMLAQVAKRRELGIYLNTVGVGMDNHNDDLLEQLADRGDGLCNYVDDEREVKRALVDNFSGAMQTVARDVKIQVEFDPAQVERYRLLGYENRAVADRDFRNDAVDAGEVGAGHQVVALYEIVRSQRVGDGPIATARLRYKQPFGEGGRSEANEKATEIAQAIHWREARSSYEQASLGYRRSIVVAHFAEFLRRSVHARGASLDQLIAEARRLERELADPRFAELCALIEASKQLVLRELAGDACVRGCDDYRREQYRKADLEERGCEPMLLSEAQKRCDALELALRDCLRNDGSSLKKLGY